MREQERLVQQLRAEKVSSRGALWVRLAGGVTGRCPYKAGVSLSPSDFLSPGDSSQYGDNLC